MEIDGIESKGGIYLLGSTNRLDQIDPAVLRPGRFGVKILIELPNEEERLSIINIYTNRIRKHVAIEYNENDLVKDTANMSGAEIEQIFNIAKIEAANRIILDEGKGKRKQGNKIKIKIVQNDIDIGLGKINTKKNKGKSKSIEQYNPMYN
jgi:SpoVK/Ycf46/Vps4 family AAA+-type ATPase